ncbi:integrator complex subunit 8 [Aricia agestis]|uniref:integrator complex subunit 8 n=1 Tax=Aricia agestis TaxID=91739 RepID=UPI001C2072A4|nr:integrator complex subunit 8 [Aricia agestis]XP_041974447.1 integrator complex subunit 8 [Aricia agestis]XP_041974448.1 integrator complex subunit 8 [Aricia agestis]XP_041974449.1 integrator complex subunit 8 [Aricia agestis]XP_041974451.1 integrator complex subunit 8 [Aricia agestis]XP_041974452.1 integrator complex subunit 8 [Aricia agestis]XP_041974453.1 integrator complex subunit 8 [Aricia agestis]
MDVDLLRPGTVPISPDTLLWFEFLLDADLLKNHLSKPNPDPTACDLIEEFLRVDCKNANSKPTSERVVDIDGPPSPPAATNPTPLTFTKKQLALKILALKVASTLHWNLDIFESKLAPLTQQCLMQDLVYMATDAAFVVPPQDVCRELDVQKPQVQFALTLYHRWILRFPVKAALYAKSTKMTFHLPGMQADGAFNPLNQNFEKILRMCEANRMQSIGYLDSVLSYFDYLPNKDSIKIKVPVMEAFVHLTETSEDMEHNWEAGDTYISYYELAMQIHFDLCYNYFFYGQHDLAKQHILLCNENSSKLEKDVKSNGYDSKDLPWGKCNYASVAKEDIFGYIRALNLGSEVLNEEPSLMQKLQESVANHYTGLIAILQADNLSREIPLVHREVVELDIQGSASSGAFTVARDLLNRVSALNAVRYALEGGIPSTHPDFNNRLNTFGTKYFDLLFWAIAPVLASDLSEEDWQNLKMFFLHLGTSQFKVPIDKIDDYLRKYVGDAAKSIRRKLISDDELQIILNDQSYNEDDNLEFPKELLTDDWETPDFEIKSVPDLEMGRLKKRLIEASTADDVRLCLVKLAMMSPSAPLWKLSPTWKPPGALGNALIALPRGFLQDFGYVVSGASRARAEAGCARSALSLLSVLEGEARNQLGGSSDPVLYRLCRLLTWEVLLLQVIVMLSDWPHHRINLTALANKCKACIAAATSGDGIIPRPQVIEACWTCLVNACEWDGAGAATGPGEAAAALCAACFELQRGKATRKFPRALWDYALSVYNNGANGPVKRSAGGVPTHSRDTPNAAAEARSAFNAFLATLREPLAVSVVLSLLARIHNLLNDDSSLELVVEYTSLWPSNISNANNYNVKFVLESLTELLERSLKLYPYNTSWLRVYGDVEMSLGRWGAALRRYMCALAGGSWHFAKRAPDEPAIARRAARCCQALHAPTQAAALSQLAEEPDYATAFKCFAEKTGNTSDAMDAYYGCVWDGTLLEVCVALHARRGEGGRRARAVTAAGALELNANNGDDIAREAAAVRRARLLRALTNQYVAS